MRSAVKSTCSAVGKSFGFLLDAPTSKSTSIFPSRERVRKPALLITRMAQRRRLKTNFQALPNGQDVITAPLLAPSVTGPLLFEHKEHQSAAHQPKFSIGKEAEKHNPSGSVFVSAFPCRSASMVELISDEPQP